MVVMTTTRRWYRPCLHRASTGPGIFILPVHAPPNSLGRSWCVDRRTWKCLSLQLGKLRLQEWCVHRRGGMLALIVPSIIAPPRRDARQCQARADKFVAARHCHLIVTRQHQSTVSSLVGCGTRNFLAGLAGPVFKSAPPERALTVLRTCRRMVPPRPSTAVKKKKKRGSCEGGETSYDF